MDRKLKNGLMNKMEHQQRTYASFVESVRKQTHMLKKKEDEVKRLRGGLIEKERFLYASNSLLRVDGISTSCSLRAQDGAG